MKYYTLIIFICLIGIAYSCGVSPLKLVHSVQFKIDSIVDKWLEESKEKHVPLFTALHGKGKKKKREGIKVKKLFTNQQIKKFIYFILFLFIVMTFSQKSLLVIPIGYSILVFADIGYMQMQKQKKQDLLEDMQIMLTAITNTYNFCPNFNIAIESNKNILSGEIKNAFDKYLTICEIAGSDYIRNLEAIKPMINHYLWENWIEAVKESIRASNKKIQLSYIIDDINKACDFNEIVENEVFKGKQDFMLSIVLTLAGMLLVTFLYDGGIEAILNTWLGNLVLAVTLCIILFTYHGCISMLLNASYEKLEVK